MATMIELRDITKRFGQVGVLASLNLTIEEGAFTSLLGSSGSGKTTILNLIGGLDQPTSGELLIGNERVFSSAHGVDTPAQRRNVGFVFQSYALWPHMRVLDNVAYPLRVRGATKEQRHATAKEILGRLELGGLADRYPFELSGGQQQRVAIARALSYRPRVLLLDEPLSSLDAQLRERARAWLVHVHREFQLTTVLVTHDHVEALSLSDRVVLLRQGKVEQDASASEIYEQPRTAYAADFVGGANIFDGRVESSEKTAGDGFATKVALGEALSVRLLSATGWSVGASVRVAVRPRRVELVDRTARADESEIVLPLTVSSALYRGDDWEVVGKTAIGEMRLVSDRPPGEKSTFIRIGAEDCRCLAE